MEMSVSVRLPRDLEIRLNDLSLRTGHSKAHHVREALVLHLDDLERMYFEEIAFLRIQSVLGPFETENT